MPAGLHSKELDSEKVQLQVHTRFTEHCSTLENNTELTTADTAAARLIIYQSLDYSSRYRVDAVLFPGKKGKEESQYLYEAMCRLSDNQYAYLIRMALAAKSDATARMPQILFAEAFFLLNSSRISCIRSFL